MTCDANDMVHRKPVTVRKQKRHVCSACGKAGHRIERCKLPAAKQILALRRSLHKLKSEKPKQRFKARVTVQTAQKGGSHKKQAQKQYGSGHQASGSRADVAHKVWTVCQKKDRVIVGLKNSGFGSMLKFSVLNVFRVRHLPGERVVGG